VDGSSAMVVGLQESRATGGRDGGENWRGR